MSAVYIVTQGAYSDYHIVAVFGDKDVAERHAAWLNGPEGCDGYDEATVEEWSMDETPTPATGAYSASCDLLIRGENVKSFVGYGNRRSTHWDPNALPDRAAIVEVSEFGGRHLWVEAYGATSEHALRSMDELCRAIRSGSYVVEGVEPGSVI